MFLLPFKKLCDIFGVSEYRNFFSIFYHSMLSFENSSVYVTIKSHEFVTKFIKFMHAKMLQELTMLIYKTIACVITKMSGYLWPIEIAPQTIINFLNGSFIFWNVWDLVCKMNNFPFKCTIFEIACYFNNSIHFFPWTFDIASQVNNACDRQYG